MSLPRVLVAHNFYQLPGGEDGVVAAETALLQSHGHEVASLLRHNYQISVGGARDRLRAARDCVWSPASARAMREQIRYFRPDVIHVHNTLAVLSPAIYWAAAEQGIPVVQTLHNYRLACPQGMFLREGRICQDCLGQLPLPAVQHGCYRESRLQSMTVAAMLVTHRAIGTWSRKISRYIVLSDFCRELFIRAGVPAERIRVKPNFTAAPAPEQREVESAEAGGDFLFVGRLSPEKGLAVVARALELDASLSCVVVGDGPGKEAALQARSLVVKGWLDKAGVSGQMRHAAAVILPSIWHEPFGLVALEAMAHGVPVIASRIGSLPEVIREGRTGMLFEAGNAQELAQKMRWARENPGEMQIMGRAARADHQERFSAQENYRLLRAVYDDAIAAAPI